MAHHLSSCRLHILGADTNPPCLPAQQVQWERLSLRQSLWERLRQQPFDTVLHTGFLWPGNWSSAAQAAQMNVRLMHELLLLAKYGSIKHFVLLSAAYLYGPSEHTSGVLPETAPLAAAAQSDPRLSTMAWMDTAAQAFLWQHGHIAVTILRPVYTLGPTLRNAESRVLRLPKVPVPAGYDTMVQVVHETDVAHAVEQTLRQRARGVFHLTGTGQLPLSRLVQQSGGTTLPLPTWSLQALGEDSASPWRPSWPSGIDGLRFACLVDGTQAPLKLGYRPRIDPQGAARSLHETFNCAIGSQATARSAKRKRCVAA